MRAHPVEGDGGMVTQTAAPDGTAGGHDRGPGYAHLQVVDLPASHEVQPDHLCDLGIAWLVDDLLRGPLLDQMTRLDEVQMVGQRQGIERVVGHLPPGFHRGRPGQCDQIGWSALLTWVTTVELAGANAELDIGAGVARLEVLGDGCQRFGQRRRSRHDDRVPAAAALQPAGVATARAAPRAWLCPCGLTTGYPSRHGST